MSLSHKILRKPFFGRFEVPWVWPSNSEQSDWERVSFQSGNGAQLQGLWGVAASETGDTGNANATLVLAHPMGKAAKGFWLRYGHAELFRQAGFNVLVFDANGFGESQGKSFDYPADILAAGIWAQRRHPHLSVGLIGASFGAAWGLCSLAREGSPYQAAVLEAAFPTLPDFWKHYPIANAAIRMSQVVWPSLERNLRPERQAALVKGNPSVLLIHGDADIYTPPHFGERLQRAFGAAAKTELMILPGVDHTFAYRDAADAYRARVIPFLNAALRKI